MVKKLIYILILLFLLPCMAHAAFYPLEITNIKPAGTGDPAIPSTNRIFKAYPGIEYNIRAAVRGGVYPYTFSLSNAPSGMSIDSFTGEITWTNPQSDSGTITLSVTDSENTTVTADWSITVTTAGFLFIDSSHTGTESGTLSEPYSSMQSFVDNTTDADWEKIVYFRGGDYELPTYNAGGNFNSWDVGERRSLNWIGYPGEDVFVDCGYNGIRSSHTFHFDNINFGRIRKYFMQTQGEEDYMTIRRCQFWDFMTNDDNDRNYGGLYTAREETYPGEYLVIQDNVYSHWKSNSVMSAIGSLYNQENAIIENNYFFEPIGSYYYNLGISPKSQCYGLTIRGNKVVMGNGTPVGNNNSYFSDTDSEICFNVFHKTNTSGTLHRWNDSGHVDDSPQRELYYHRNTSIGPETYLQTDVGSWDIAGPFNFSDNVLLITTNDMYVDDPNVIWTNNLEDTQANWDTVVDSDYKLLAAYDEHRYDKGWEIDGHEITFQTPIRELPMAFVPMSKECQVYDPGESPWGEIHVETDDANLSYTGSQYCYDLLVEGVAYKNAPASTSPAAISKVEVKIGSDGTYADAVDVSSGGDWSKWESNGRLTICEGSNDIYFRVTDVDGNTSEKWHEITMTDETTSTPEPPWILTISTTGSGSIAKDPDNAEYSDGTSVELTATPDSGWEFDSWGGDLSGSTNPETITMDSDKSVTATFTEVTTTAAAGVISTGTGNGQIGVGSGSGSIGVE